MMKYSPDTPRATADPTMPHGARAGADTGAGIVMPAEAIPVKVRTEAAANNDVFIFLLLKIACSFLS
jgi:hypothetical protein